VKPPGWIICLGVDHQGLWWTESLMEKSVFIRTKLFNVRVIEGPEKMIRVEVNESQLKFLEGT
jgi:hypothetical protein